MERDNGFLAGTLTIALMMAVVLGGLLGVAAILLLLLKH